MGLEIRTPVRPNTSIYPGGNQWIASPTGLPTNNGSFANPWDLQTAFNGGFPNGVVHPGDTILARGGTYNGQYTIYDSGNPLSPNHYQNYPGEQPTIDSYITTNLTAGIDAVTTTNAISMGTEALTTGWLGITVLSGSMATGKSMLLYPATNVPVAQYGVSTDFTVNVTTGGAAITCDIAVFGYYE